MRTLLTALFLGLLPAILLGQTIDWTTPGINSFNLVDGQLVSTANNVCTATNVTATFSNPSGAPRTPFPDADATNNIVIVGFDLTSAPNTGARLDLDFGVGNEVENLQFAVYDMDRVDNSGSAWNDRMVFQPTFNGVSTGVNFACAAASCTWTQSAANAVTSTTSSGTTSLAGQVQVTIPGPVDRVVMDYVGIGPGTNVQISGWGPLSFDCSATPILGLGIEITERPDGAAEARLAAERTEGVLALELEHWDPAKDAWTVAATFEALDGDSRLDLTRALGQQAAGASHLRVVEIDTRGRRTVHGPWERDGLPPPKLKRRLRRVKRAASERLRARAPTTGAPVFASTSSVGLVRVEASPGAAVLHRGVALPSVSQGGEVYWLAPESGDLWNREATFSVGAAAELPMPAHFLPLAADDEPAPALQRVSREENLVAATAATTLNARQDYWYWHGFLATPSRTITQHVELPLPSLPQGEPVLELEVVGGAFRNSAGRYEMDVAVNGVGLGRVAWSGQRPRTRRLAVPERVLGWANTVSLTSVPVKGQPLTVFYLDRVAIEYAGDAVAQDGRTRFVATGDLTRVYGLDSAELLGVVQPPEGGPEWISPEALAASRSSQGLLLPTIPGATYDLAEAAKVPSAVARPALRARATDFLPTELLVLAPSGLLDVAHEYAAARSAAGVPARAVDLEWVYQRYAHGLERPAAITSYLRHLRRRGALPDVALLMGKGTFDHRDFGAHGDSLVPAELMATPFGLYAADNQLGDLEGDGPREVLVARLPVTHPDDVRAYLAKVEGFAAASSASVLVSDDADPAGDFPAQTDRLRELVSAHSVLSLEESAADELFDQLVAAWAEEPAVFVYTGHGSSTQLADENILETADVESLEGTIGLALSLSCAVNRFEIPGFLSLGEALVLEPGAGALLSVAPTGLSFSEPSFELGESLLLGLRHPSAHLGRLLLHSLNEFERRDGRGLTGLYAVLGDPTALRTETLAAIAPQALRSVARESLDGSRAGDAAGQAQEDAGEAAELDHPLQDAPPREDV